MPRISIIMPAYRAQKTIAKSVRSLVEQNLSDWELLVICDDGSDYEAVLDVEGIADTRIRFLTTGETASGSSHARNVGLDAASAEWIAILDADDLMLAGKLTAMAAALEKHGLVSTGLSVTDATGVELRTVGVGADKSLRPAAYKFTNFSMDSMIGYDRRYGDPRYDRALPCLTDLDLILKLFATNTHCFHLGRPLHAYVKQAVSITNGPGASDKIARTKFDMLKRLKAGDYPMLDETGPDGMTRFLELSLRAEADYGSALATRPGRLFEDHLEPVLIAASTV